MPRHTHRHTHKHTAAFNMNYPQATSTLSMRGGISNSIAVAMAYTRLNHLGRGRLGNLNPGEAPPNLQPLGQLGPWSGSLIGLNELRWSQIGACFCVTISNSTGFFFISGTMTRADMLSSKKVAATSGRHVWWEDISQYDTKCLVLFHIHRHIHLFTFQE